MRSYGPGKFHTLLDSFIYEWVLDGVADGEASFPEGGGAYALIRLDDADEKYIADLEKKSQEETGKSLTRDELETLVAARGGGVIFFERSDGIVESEYFDNKKKLDKVWEEIEEEVSEHYEDGE